MLPLPSPDQSTDAASKPMLWRSDMLIILLSRGLPGPSPATEVSSPVLLIIDESISLVLILGGSGCNPCSLVRLILVVCLSQTAQF